MKTKTVSSSTASGDSLRKRSADEIGLEDESKSKPAPPKLSKVGFSMTAKKSAPISIKLGASVCTFFVFYFFNMHLYIRISVYICLFVLFCIPFLRDFTF